MCLPLTLMSYTPLSQGSMILWFVHALLWCIVFRRLKRTRSSSSSNSDERPTILLLGTLDTKGSEYQYVREFILKKGEENVLLADVGRTAADLEIIDITQDEILKHHPQEISSEDFRNLPRGEVIQYLATSITPIVKDLFEKGTIHGILALGGSGGTSLAAQVMRDALPMGFPKLIISTVASGDISPYIGQTDITMMYSIVDIAGLNSILSAVLENGAAAIVGMAQTYCRRQEQAHLARRNSQVIAISMFGVTTPAVEAARKYIESQNKDERYEIFVFHATGAGGKSMEQLVKDGRVDAMLDLTTTELADELVGGVMTAGPGRLTAAAKAGVPQIVSVGALDIVNFGPLKTVPSQFKERKLFQHNPNVTIMRTNAHECRELGHRVGHRLRQHAANPKLIQVWLPEKGTSILSGIHGEFFDANADAALFSAIEEELSGSQIKVVRLPNNINDEEFAVAAARKLQELMGTKS